MFRVLPFSVRNRDEKLRDNIENTIDTIFGKTASPIGRVTGAVAPFRVDAVEMPDRYIVSAELSGYSKSDITLEYADNCLTIRAERSEDDTNPRYLCHERRYGVAERSFEITDIDWDSASAALNDGILTINLPKDRSEEQKNFINIE